MGLAHLLGSKKLEEAGMIVISSLAGMVCDVKRGGGREREGLGSRVRKGVV